MTGSWFNLLSAVDPSAAASCSSGTARSSASRMRLGAAIAASHHVEEFDPPGKRHGEIDIAAWDVELKAVGDESDADEQQEGEREHLGSGVGGDERADWAGREIHYDHRNHDGTDHHGEILRHADCRNDGVQ